MGSEAKWRCVLPCVRDSQATPVMLTGAMSVTAFRAQRIASSKHRGAAGRLHRLEGRAHNMNNHSLSPTNLVCIHFIAWMPKRRGSVVRNEEGGGEIGNNVLGNLRAKVGAASLRH